MQEGRILCKIAYPTFFVFTCPAGQFHTGILFAGPQYTVTSITYHREGESMQEARDPEQATFAAGCFWGVEAEFRRLPGVIRTCVGYTGGSAPHPTYTQVCSGKTGHAEAVRVLFDPGIITYDRLLDRFWEIHDPTQVDGQGPDIGTNYRSAIFYHSPEQKIAADTSRDKIQRSGRFGKRPVVTEIVPAATFWMAEEYHQQYYEKCGAGFSVSRHDWE